MEMVALNMDVPRAVFNLLRKSNKEVSKEAKKIMALELFREKKLSLGKASELAEMCLAEFMDLMRYYKIPIRDYTEEELKMVFNNAEEISKEVKKQ